MIQILNLYQFGTINSHVDPKENILSCDRCGQCCIHFAGEIFYWIDELEKYGSQNCENPLFKWFFLNRDRFKGIKFGKEVIFIPSWKDALNLLPSNLLKLYYNPNISSNACLFLQFEEKKLAKCLIQSIKSDVCTRYPAFKGYACLNHPELRYSLAFFEFQTNRNKLHRQFVQDLYGDFLTDHHALDVFILLLDHGVFKKLDVAQFALNMWDFDAIRFEQLLSQLENVGIVKQVKIDADFMLEAITTDELKSLADKFLSV